MLQMLGGLFKRDFADRLELAQGWHEDASVLLLVPVCNESPEVLQQTIIACQALEGPVRLVVLENSSDPDKKQWLEEGCEKWGVECYSMENLGNKARALNFYLEDQPPKEKYLAVLDVDQKPHSNFITELLPRIAADEALAMIQTPQHFRNAGKNWMTLFYASMQDIFFRGVSVARGRIGFTPCLGTNFIMRLSALKEVGGFDESSQTEDVATSLSLNLAGYKSEYFNQVLVEGLVPTRFRDLLKQMKRYTIGSNQILGKIFGRLLWNPRVLSKKGNLLTLIHYSHYASTLLIGSLIFYLSFFSESILVWYNLICIGVFLFLMLVWLPFYKMIAGFLFFTIILPFLMIFNLDITAYNKKFAVTQKDLDEGEELEYLELTKEKEKSLRS
jgi:cellulose synthase/poly-beta-1,6-N-acetylglucosamine synthase-like glycosyltransferase